MSTNPRIYLDHNATSPLVPAAREAMVRALDVLGNPSSIHAEGRAARDLVERARDAVATLVGRPREQVVFTSGGTEANALGVLGLAATVERGGGPRVVATTPFEHPSLSGAIATLVARGWEVRHLPVDRAGRIAVPALDGVGIVALAAVNHELGTIADLPAIAAAAARAKARLHVDAVQAAGKLSLPTITADSLALSAHKLGGPLGTGALVAAPILDDALPIVDGGHQERGRRAGTENVVGIAGFGAAAAAANPAGWPAIAALGAAFEAQLLAIDGARIHGAGTPRTGGTINVAFTGARGQSVVVALDLAGIAASTGAACTSGSVQPSPVLLALGLAPARALEAVRFSLGASSTAAELDAVAARMPAIVARVRAATRS